MNFQARRVLSRLGCLRCEDLIANMMTGFRRRVGSASNRLEDALSRIGYTGPVLARTLGRALGTSRVMDDLGTCICVEEGRDNDTSRYAVST